MNLASDPATKGLQVYIVGGAVRDALLGLAAGDRDWVVVGASPEDMAARGFLPVGGDFPVFLHPQTHEEYALARTERKSGRGYKGFTFYTGADVTLEQDLQRRDLTVNAIAQAPDGRLIDPMQGQNDIRLKVLRHVGRAFTEDPVRLLRLARFAARFTDFSIADETLALAKLLVNKGEVDALVPERVWQEMAKGLAAVQPGRMFQILESTGALARVMPGLQFSESLVDDLACAARADFSIPMRFALLCRLSNLPDSVGAAIRAPSVCQDYARLLPLVLSSLGIANDAKGPDRPDTPIQSGPQQWLDLIERCDAIRKPERFLDLITTVSCVNAGDLQCVPDQANLALWQQRVNVIRSLDAGAVAKQYQDQPKLIKQAVRLARLDALQAAIDPAISATDKAL